ncbi:MAG: zonular occludens toxin domain-containing protein [Planctomycetota bacterium]
MPKVPDHRCEIMEGLPGAGKSFALVRMMIDIITQQKRPVYAGNFPLKFKVFRRYMKLKHGEEYANLVFELTLDHWKRFLARQDKLAKFRSEYRDLCAREGKRYSNATADRLFFEQNGPHISRPSAGQVANWVEPWAFIFIDEAQMWHAAVAVGGKRDDDHAALEAQFKSYLSHHRHHHHDLMFATQAFENLNHTLRRIYRTRWVVRNMGQMKLVGGLKLGDLGIKFIAYACWPKEVYDAWRGAGLPEDPIYHKNLWPQLPWYQVYFRLYQSFTHAGSALDQSRRLKEIQCEAGVDDEAIAARMNAEEREPMHKFLRRVVRWLLTGAVFATIGIIIGTQMGRSSAEEHQAQLVATKESDDAPFVSEDQRITAFGLNRVVIGPHSVSVGEEFQGATLRIVDIDERSTLWSSRAGMWLWGPGPERPKRIVTREALQDLGRRVEGLVADRGPSESDPAAGGG